jgi:formate dehydrogenase accessory protein FdhE
MTSPFDLRERVLTGFEALRQLPHVPGDYLDFRRSLYRAQLAAFDALDIKTDPSLPPGKENLPLDQSGLSKFLEGLEASLAELSSARAELKELNGRPEILEEMVRAAVFGPDLDSLRRLSDQAGVSEDGLLFFGRAACAPHLSKILWTFPDDAFDIAPDARPCPFCGSAPGFSILRGETGRRFLSCSLCGREWEYPRMKCPFCGELGALEIIRESEAAPRWVESCGSCRGYIKNSDERKLGSAGLVPLLESVSTLYLDFIAEKQGCKRSLPYAAMR